MKVQAIGYKENDLLDKGIKAGSGYPYNHTAFLFPDGTVADARIKGGFNRYDLHDCDNCHADIYDILINDEQMNQLVSEIGKEQGKHGYDFKGIFGYVVAKCWGLSWFYHSRKRWFCSEAIMILLRRVGAFLLNGYEPQEVSPGKLLSAGRFKKVATVKIENRRIVGIVERYN